MPLPSSSLLHPPFSIILSSISAPTDQNPPPSFPPLTSSQPAPLRCQPTSTWPVRCSTTHRNPKEHCFPPSDSETETCHVPCSMYHPDSGPQGWGMHFRTCHLVAQIIGSCSHLDQALLDRSKPSGIGVAGVCQRPHQVGCLARCDGHLSPWGDRKQCIHLSGEVGRAALQSGEGGLGLSGGYVTAWEEESERHVGLGAAPGAGLVNAVTQISNQSLQVISRHAEVCAWMKTVPAVKCGDPQHR